MTTAQWCLLVGGLLAITGVAHGYIRRLPITSSIIYLAVGLLVGPTVLHLFHFNPLKESALLEVITEAAVLISLYAAGVKMPVPVSLARWRKPILLATASMAVSVGLVAAFAVLVLDLPLGMGVLLGAIIAPTDPVLATDVQIRHPRDRDRLRFNLTCEAGMNDGSAFPFVMLGLGLLGLHDLGDAGLRWVFLDVVWATIAGVAIGWLMGMGIAKIVWKMQSSTERNGLLHDFIALGLIGIVYGVSESVHGWGFLAVFFAAVAMRQTELKLRKIELPPGSRLARRQTPCEEPDSPKPVSEGSLVFKEHLERLSEIVLIILVGGSLFIDSWSWRAVSLAVFVFFIARPVSVAVGLLPARTNRRQTAMMAWFGIRGIGSLYYLMYAIQHGLPESQGLELIHFTLIVVTLSIIVHGVSVTPLMKRFHNFQPA